MKKILFVVSERKMGGVSTVLEDILNNIDYSNILVDVLILNNKGTSLKNLPNNVNLIVGDNTFDDMDLTLSQAIKSKSIKSILNKLKMIFLIKTGLINLVIKIFRKKILINKYDVEIAFQDGFPALFVGLGDTHYKVAWLHSDYNLQDPCGHYYKLFNNIFKRFDKFIAVSEKTKKHFMKKYNVENVLVISNIIDNNKVVLKSTEEKITKNKKIRLISVCRIHPMKGIDRLIKVIYELKKDNLMDNVELIIVGDGPNRKEYEELVDSLNLSDTIFFVGMKLNPYPWTKSADLFVLSSRHEPFGLVIVESLLLGVPVLATDNAATKKLINQDVTGLNVDNSEDGLYNGLKTILQSPKLIEKYKRNLINYRYDNEKTIKKINKLLQ